MPASLIMSKRIRSSVGIEKGSGLFWRWKSKPTGRPCLPKDLRKLIREMGGENPTWGEERIANELKAETYDPGFAAHGRQVPAQGRPGAHA